MEQIIAVFNFEIFLASEHTIYLIFPELGRVVYFTCVVKAATSKCGFMSLNKLIKIFLRKRRKNAADKDLAALGHFLLFIYLK
ncbi:MAG: hypothetical protein ACO1OF_17570 [Adhaeribacter sp.]